MLKFDVADSKLMMVLSGGIPFPGSLIMKTIIITHACDSASIANILKRLS